MTNTYWIVSEIGYDYNDEIYRQPECGGSTPTELYRTEEKALAAALAKNIKWLSQHDLAEYYYDDIEDIFHDINEVNALFGDNYGHKPVETAIETEDSYRNAKTPSKLAKMVLLLPPDAQEAFFDNLVCKGYEVCEIKLAD